MNLYESIGVAPDADVEEIRRAIAGESAVWGRRAGAAAALHVRHEAEVTMQALAEARQVLLDPDKRKAYDETLSSQSCPVGGEPGAVAKRCHACQRLNALQAEQCTQCRAALWIPPADLHFEALPGAVRPSARSPSKLVGNVLGLLVALLIGVSVSAWYFGRGRISSVVQNPATIPTLRPNPLQSHPSLSPIFADSDIVKSRVWSVFKGSMDEHHLEFYFGVGSIPLTATFRFGTPPPAGARLLITGPETDLETSLGPDVALPGEFENWPGDDSIAQLAAYDVTRDGRPELIVALQDMGMTVVTFFEYVGMGKSSWYDEPRLEHRFKKLGVLRAQYTVKFKNDKILIPIGSQGWESAHKWDAERRAFLIWDPAKEQFVRDEAEGDVVRR
jgi:hypothetical protein